MTSGSTGTPNVSALRALFLAVAWIALSPPAFAQDALHVELQAPESVRPLLERHLRILAREREIPGTRADRIALSRRTRREAADLLATEGYFTPDIGLRRDADRWRIDVDPGPRSQVVDVDLRFEGDLAGGGEGRAERRAALRAAWPLPPGVPFRQGAWDEAKQRLLDDVSLRHYAAARIADSRAEIDPEAASARLSVTIDSGPRFSLGPLEVSGIENLPPDFVERFNLLDAGEPFDQERLLQLQTVLQNQPQFASVVVDIERDPQLAAAVPVRVQVTEAQSRQLGFGAGYSTNTGFRVETSWRDVNLFDRGWELATGLRIEQRASAAYADVFLPPSAKDYRDSFGAALERNDIEDLKLTTQAVGWARTRTRGNIDTRFSVRLQQEKREPQGADSDKHTALSASWRWSRRRVDNLLDPRNGDVLQFEIGGGAKALLSDQDFLRLYGRYVYYRPVAERDVLILRAEGGATIATSREGIPQDFLFRTGGAQTVRGYDFQSLGVREGEATVGGRYLGVASAEYVHWFRPKWGVAAFVDVGDAADGRNTFDAKVGYGVGGRWKSPAGPLAVDLAYGEADGKLRLHFGIAIAF